VGEEPVSSAAGAGEWSRMLRDPLLPDVEVLRAHFLQYRYAPHWHDAVCVALVGGGAAAFQCGRGEYVAPAGSVFVIPAYQVHTGEPAAPAGLDYRVLYISPQRMAEILADDLRGELGSAPSELVHARTAVAEPLAWFHRAIAVGAVPLEREHALLASLAAVAREFGGATWVGSSSPEHRAVRRARDYLHEHATAPVTLSELARAAGLSVSRLARTFSAEMGMPPHAYQVQLRVLMAKRWLAAGKTIIQTAADSGFYDQAHLTYHFKRHVGVTPGHYVRHAA
jgi:AraC-like DNA-binding protein